MKLFRAKRDFQPITQKGIGLGYVFQGQLFAVLDETYLPDPRVEYPGNLKPFYEEILPNSRFYSRVSQLIKTKEL